MCDEKMIFGCHEILLLPHVYACTSYAAWGMRYKTRMTRHSRTQEKYTIQIKLRFNFSIVNSSYSFWAQNTAREGERIKLEYIKNSTCKLTIIYHTADFKRSLMLFVWYAMRCDSSTQKRNYDCCVNYCGANNFFWFHWVKISAACENGVEHKIDGTWWMSN